MSPADAKRPLSKQQLKEQLKNVQQVNQEQLQQIEQLTAALQRERADADNSRKRFNADKVNYQRDAKADILRQLLPLLDNLDRAFAMPPQELVDNNWVKGVLYIQQQLQGYCQKLNLEPMQVIDQPFDPQTMAVVEVVQDATKPADVVVAELEKGYLYDGQVLRVAQVKVVQNSPAEQS